MDFNFVFAVFCLTVIAVVAIVNGQSHIAEVAVSAIAGLQSSIREFINHLKGQ